jgi:putative membrane protein
MNYTRQCLTITAILLAAPLCSAPSSAAALSTTGPAQPLPDNLAAQVILPVAESVSAGSATLVPLMAADLPATAVSTVDASAPTGAATAGKPVDALSFVAKATASGHQEIRSAREALPQLKDAELKRMAERLAADHGDANARLAELADSKGWPVPARPRHEPPPAGSAAPDFDAKWIAEMIAAHERSVALYSAQAQGGEDFDLRRFARETLPTIQHHLAELRRLQK